MTPCARSQSALPGPAMPSTRALRRTNSCTTRLPTPPAAAETATVSPGWGATERTAAYAVAPTTYSEPAVSQLNWVGLWINWFTGTAVWVAWLDRRKLNPSTSSPTANSVTSGPTALTTPARSLPSPEGNVAGNISCTAPTRMPASPGLMPAARTSTTTSPVPGDGMSISATYNTSRPP